MNYRNCLLLIVFLFSSSAFPALGEGEETVFVAVGAKFQNFLVQRGATLYPNYQISPVIYVSLFGDRIQFLGNSLEYTDFLYGRFLRGRTKLAMLSDDPFFTTGIPKGIGSSRDTTFEWSVTLEKYFPNFDERVLMAVTTYAKDLKESKGDYLETSLRLSVARFGNYRDKKALELQVFGTIGFGGARHNQFWYGPEATSASFNHYAAGLHLLFSEYDPHYPLLTLMRYEVLGSSNRSGARLGGKRGGYYLQLTLAKGLFSI